MSFEDKVAEERDRGREARRDNRHRTCSFVAVSLRDAWFAGWDAEDERQKAAAAAGISPVVPAVPPKTPFFEIVMLSGKDEFPILIRGAFVTEVADGSFHMANGMLYFVKETREQILRLVESCKGGF